MSLSPVRSVRCSRCYALVAPPLVGGPGGVCTTCDAADPAWTLFGPYPGPVVTAATTMIPVDGMVCGECGRLGTVSRVCAPRGALDGYLLCVICGAVSVPGEGR